MSHGTDTYVKPTVHDYGSLVDLTSAASFQGLEDGASKVVGPHHSGPIVP